MNYIKKLEIENEALRASLKSTEERLTELMAYLSGDKFKGQDGDYVHISTDLYPRLREIRAQI